MRGCVPIAARCSTLVPSSVGARISAPAVTRALTISLWPCCDACRPKHPSVWAMLWLDCAVLGRAGPGQARPGQAEQAIAQRPNTVDCHESQKSHRCYEWRNSDSLARCQTMTARAAMRAVAATRAAMAAATRRREGGPRGNIGRPPNPDHCWPKHRIEQWSEQHVRDGEATCHAGCGHRRWRWTRLVPKAKNKDSD